MGKIANNAIRNRPEELVARADERLSVPDRLREFADAPIDKHLERIGFLLERAIRIPGTDFRIGLDPIIGFFFPVVGDWVGGLVGVYVILASIRHGLPKSVITKMVFNVGVDFLLGSLPVVGDAFDFAWKSNTKNLRLLNRHASGKRGSAWSDWAWVLVLLGILAVVMIAIVGVALYALRSTGVGLI